MVTTIEITGSAIRLCRDVRGKLTSLESFPIPAGVDPLDALGEAPLPRPLGKVNVVLYHVDMLMRTMLQPPCPAERLDRIVRFELQGMGTEDSEPVAISWHLIKGMGSGDMRILALLTKRRLISRVAKCLARHGAKLGSLVYPAVGLFHAYQRQFPEDREPGLVLDIGGKHIHLVMVQDGELLFLRSQSPGMEDLVKQVAELRGIAADDASRLIAKLGKGAPADLHDLIRRQAQAVAGMVGNNLRFAKAQLHLDQFEPKALYLGGAGAQVHGFAEALGERLQLPVRLINPFAGVLSSIPPEQLDQQAALPSPWTAALGVALSDGLELDAVSEDRERRTVFWRTDGALRAAAAVAVALVLVAFVRQLLAGSAVEDVIERLKGDGSGLVPTAVAAHTTLDRLRLDQEQAGQRLGFLDAERRPGRVALELLSAIAEQQDPTTCPVVLQKYLLKRTPGLVEVELKGFAQTAAGRSTADVLRAFEQQLVKNYGPISEVKQLSTSIVADHQEFHFLIRIPDVAEAPAVVKAP